MNSCCPVFDDLRNRVCGRARDRQGDGTFSPFCAKHRKECNERVTRYKMLCLQGYKRATPRKLNNLRAIQHEIFRQSFYLKEVSLCLEARREAQDRCYPKWWVEKLQLSQQDPGREVEQQRLNSDILQQIYSHVTYIEKLHDVAESIQAYLQILYLDLKSAPRSPEPALPTSRQVSSAATNRFQPLADPGSPIADPGSPILHNNMPTPSRTLPEVTVTRFKDLKLSEDDDAFLEATISNDAVAKQDLALQAMKAREAMAMRFWEVVSETVDMSMKFFARSKETLAVLDTMERQGQAAQLFLAYIYRLATSDAAKAGWADKSQRKIFQAVESVFNDLNSSVGKRVVHLSDETINLLCDYVHPTSGSFRLDEQVLLKTMVKFRKNMVGASAESLRKRRTRRIHRRV